MSKAITRIVRKSLGEFGKYLAMRPSGLQVQQALDAALRELPPGSVLVLDFQGVEMMDYSFADEAFGSLYARMAAREYPDRYMVLAMGDDEVSRALLENIEVALQQRDVAALVVPRDAIEASGQAMPSRRESDQWEVIGVLPEHLLDTLRAVMEKEQVTVRDLAEALHLDSATACNNRVAKLHQLRLVRREAAIVPEGGRQYCYSSVI